jgi:hypothetical protein
VAGDWWKRKFVFEWKIIGKEERKEGGGDIQTLAISKVL